VRGTWYRIPKPNPSPFLPSEIPYDNDEVVLQQEFPAPPDWGNITYREAIIGNQGKFSLELSELNQNTTVQFVEASLNVGKATGDGVYKTKLHGVHFPLTGDVILVSTTPRKYNLHVVSVLTLDSKDFH
jgi:hypothetical protein